MARTSPEESLKIAVRAMMISDSVLAPLAPTSIPTVRYGQLLSGDVLPAAVTYFAGGKQDVLLGRNTGLYWVRMSIIWVCPAAGDLPATEALNERTRQLMVEAITGYPGGLVNPEQRIGANLSGWLLGAPLGNPARIQGHASYVTKDVSDPRYGTGYWYNLQMNEA
jgi:hypothetical protein